MFARILSAPMQPVRPCPPNLHVQIYIGFQHSVSSRPHHEISEVEPVPSKIFEILVGFHIKISFIAIVFQEHVFQLYFSFV